MELAQDRVQWLAVVLAVLNLRILLPERYFIDLREMGCDNGRWMELAQDRVQWLALVLAVLNLPPDGMCVSYLAVDWPIVV
jgi:hypothetical protein